MELIKKITKVGNAANVLLPKTWLGKMAKVELIETPLNIVKNEVWNILSPYLKDILGIYIVGSYARNELTDKSDIDILVITNKENKEIHDGQYSLILISKDTLEKTLKYTILPLLPMLKESIAILNEKLIEKYKKIKLTKNSIKWNIDMTKSALEISKGFIELAEQDNDNISDGIMYSLILGVRTIYIINCIKNNIIPSSQGLKRLIKSLTKSLSSYDAYLRSKANKQDKLCVSPDTARLVYIYVSDKITKEEKIK